MINITRHPDRLGQTLFAKVPQVPGAWIGRPIALVPKITTGDNSERTCGGQRA